MNYTIPNKLRLIMYWVTAGLLVIIKMTGAFFVGINHPIPDFVNGAQNAWYYLAGALLGLAGLHVPMINPLSQSAMMASTTANDITPPASGTGA